MYFDIQVLPLKLDFFSQQGVSGGDRRDRKVVALASGTSYNVVRCASGQLYVSVCVLVLLRCVM